MRKKRQLQLFENNFKLKCQKYKSLLLDQCQSQSKTLHDMSDTLEILEITDSSINVDTSTELAPVLQNEIKTKRRLSDPDPDVRSLKKICADDDDNVAAELIVRIFPASTDQLLTSSLIFR